MEFLAVVGGGICRMTKKKSHLLITRAVSEGTQSH